MARSGGKARSYEQYCPIAVALDIVGDRWTLLILRELFLGDRRFSDLERRLPGIAPTVLTDRLRSIESHGLVERLDLPPPAARTVYRTTAAADPLRGVLSRLARFGIRHLPDPSSAGGTASGLDHPGPMPAQGAVWAVLAPWFDHHRLDSQPRTWQLDVDGERHQMHFDGRHLQPASLVPVAGPTLELTVSADRLLAIRQRRTTLAQCLADGTASTSATAAELAEFALAFALD
jgi:DNA-binding HxlR family transcriptional regulator